MKKYKGWEIVKLISEGKLEGRKIELVNIGVGRNLSYIVSRTVIWDREYEIELGNSLLTDADNEYIIPQEPVTFMDCVNSDKLVRVEHELTNNLHSVLFYYKEFKNGEYIPFGHLMFYLSSDLNGEELRTVIEEGKWYLEEAEDGEV